MPSEPQLSPRRWAKALHQIWWKALPDADGGAGVRLNLVIDLHKGLTGPFVLGLMLAFDAFTLPAWIYLALHGSYGVAWVIKDRTIPDRRWQRRVRWPGAAAAWSFLSLYWVAPVLLVLGTAGALPLGDWEPATPPVLTAAIVSYALGLTLMIGADAQKNLALSDPAAGRGRRDEDGLIDTGFFARTRHPNYLGEILIYGAFALAVSHWLPWAILAAIWLLMFVPNMLAIEDSLSRYPGYREWRERTGFLLPRLAGRGENARR